MATAVMPQFGTSERAALAEEAVRMITSLRRHGAGPDGGVTRLVYTPEWRAAMAELEEWFASGGLEVRTDAVGTRFGRLDGRDPRVVLTGSHVDSVVTGGAYDGILGVVMAGCAVRWLAAGAGRPALSLEVFANCEEESSRFACNFWGARALTGRIAPDEPDRLLDARGTTIAEAMSSCGLDPAVIAGARRSDLLAYLEPHIEQGPELARSDDVVAVVDRIVGVRVLTITLDGVAGHAGTMPMVTRHDAMLAASEVALGAEEVARRLGAPAVATVGSLEVKPGGFNQVPGQTRLTIDFRHTEESVLDAMDAELRALVQRVAADRGVRTRIDTRLGQPGIRFDESLCARLETACEEAGVKWRRMPSHAGHDAQLIGTVCPAAMLFVPSQGGHSHRPDELTLPEHIGAGIEVLVRTLFGLAYQGLSAPE
jgi:allantoate deiminase